MDFLKFWKIIIKRNIIPNHTILDMSLIGKVIENYKSILSNK